METKQEPKRMFMRNRNQVTGGEFGTIEGYCEPGENIREKFRKAVFNEYVQDVVKIRRAVFLGDNGKYYSPRPGLVVEARYAPKKKKKKKENVERDEHILKLYKKNWGLKAIAEQAGLNAGRPTITVSDVEKVIEKAFGQMKGFYGQRRKANNSAAPGYTYNQMVMA